jgi:hypothetical protein
MVSIARGSTFEEPVSYSMALFMLLLCFITPPRGVYCFFFLLLAIFSEDFVFIEEEEKSEEIAYRFLSLLLPPARRARSEAPRCYSPPLTPPLKIKLPY